MGRVGCDTWHADIMLVDDTSGTSYVIDVAIVNIDSATALQRRGDFGDVEASWFRRRRRSGLCRSLSVSSRRRTTRWSFFVPFVMSSAGGFGPAARAFLKVLYKTARARAKWVMATGQPALERAWNTTFASTYWDMRLSVACTAASAEAVSRLVARDINMGMVTHRLRRQPWGDPSFSIYGVREGGASGG